VAEQRKRLGVASAALLGRRGADVLASLASEGEAGVTELSNAVEIDITKLATNPNQPRKTVGEEGLRELAASIAEKGILQPIVVRRAGTQFIIVAGERRYRAALSVGLERMPAIIREATGDEAIEQSLIENLQRENIDPIEESSSFRQLMQAHGYSMRDLASRLHKSHAYVAERLQLTRHEDIARAVTAGAISPKAASELARVEDDAKRQELTSRVVKGELDSRDISRAKRGEPSIRGSVPPTPSGASKAGEERAVTQAVGTPAAAQSDAKPPPRRSGQELDITPESATNVAPFLATLVAAETAITNVDITSMGDDRDAVRLHLQSLAQKIDALLRTLGPTEQR
jgi:ParB family chromosome partitioning protein